MMTPAKVPTPAASADNGSQNGTKITSVWGCIYMLAKAWGPVTATKIGGLVVVVATLYYAILFPQIESQKETRATNQRLIDVTVEQSKAAIENQTKQTAAWEQMVKLQEKTAQSQDATTIAVSGNRGLNEKQLEVMEDIRTQNAEFQAQLCEDHKAILESVDGVKKALPLN